MALPKHTERGAAEAPVTDLQEAIRRAGDGERVVVSGQGDAVAVVVPLADLRRLQEDDRRRAAALDVIMEFSRHFEDCDPDEIEREAVEAVREARAELWSERQGRAGA